MADLVAATDHRVKYINRGVIIFADHRRRRASETRNKYPFPYSNAGRVDTMMRGRMERRVNRHRLTARAADL
jgi:hypothetical protein